jgi:hypothetical protein
MPVPVVNVGPTEIALGECCTLDSRYNLGVTKITTEGHPGPVMVALQAIGVGKSGRAAYGEVARVRVSRGAIANGVPLRTGRIAGSVMSGTDNSFAIALEIPSGYPTTVQAYVKGIDSVGTSSSGSTLTWRGSWNSSTTYNVDELVEYNGSAYIAVATSTNVTPGTDITKWELFVSKGATGSTGSTGATGPAGPSQIPTSTVGAPGIPTAGDADSGFYALAGGDFGTTRNGASVMKWKDALTEVVGRQTIANSVAGVNPILDITQSGDAPGINLNMPNDTQLAFQILGPASAWYHSYIGGRYAAQLPSATSEYLGCIVSQDGVGGQLRHVLQRLNNAKELSIDLRQSDFTSGWRMQLPASANRLELASIGGSVYASLDTSELKVYSLVRQEHATNPLYSWRYTGGGSDAKQWDMIVSGGVFYHRLVNDAVSSATNIWSMARSGMTLGTLTFFPYTVIQPSGANGLLVNPQTTGGALFEGGSKGNFYIDSTGVQGGRFEVTETGMIGGGIGHTSPPTVTMELFNSNPLNWLNITSDSGATNAATVFRALNTNGGALRIAYEGIAPPAYNQLTTLTGGGAWFYGYNSVRVNFGSQDATPCYFVYGDTFRGRWDGTGFYLGGSTAPTALLELASDSAKKPSTNTWTITSDSRLKTNIAPFTDGLAVLQKIKPITYEYNGLAGTPKGAAGIGILADQLAAVIPYAVRPYKARLHPTDTEDTTLYDFNSHALTFVLINSILENDRRVTAIENAASMVDERQKENYQTGMTDRAAMHATMDSLTARVTVLEAAVKIKPKDV